MRKFLAFVGLISLAYAAAVATLWTQTSRTGRIVEGPLSIRPGTCSPGDLFYATDPSVLLLYACGSDGRSWTAFAINNQTFTGTISGATINSSVANNLVLNGTPTGTGISTFTQKIGNLSGTSYNTISAAMVDVDSTNLAYTVTIPTGWKLLMSAYGIIRCNQTADAFGVQLTDTSTSTSLDWAHWNGGDSGAANTAYKFALSYVLTGDGNSHTIKLQFNETAGIAGHTTLINNNTVGVDTPKMDFLLSPSN